MKYISVSSILLFCSLSVQAGRYEPSQLPLKNEILGKWTVDRFYCESGKDLPNAIAEDMKFAKKAKAARMFYQSGYYSMKTYSEMLIALNKSKPCIGASSGEYEVNQELQVITIYPKNSGFKNCSLRHRWVKIVHGVFNMVGAEPSIEFEYSLKTNKKQQEELHLKVPYTPGMETLDCGEDDRLIKVFRKTK